MDDGHFAALAAWLSDAGLSGQDEATMVTEFCTRLVADGLPLARGQLFIDTLHPVYGGRGYYWQALKGATVATEYKTPTEEEELTRWRRSAFYHMIETGSNTPKLTRLRGLVQRDLVTFTSTGVTAA
jgi:adenylate cyclase